MGFRWWRFSAGIMLGLACATKWSGIYVIAFFGLMTVAFDLAARYRFGVRQPVRGTVARDVAPAISSLVVLPAAVYLASYWAWFASETAVDRHAVGRAIGDGGPWGFVPDSIRSLWYNHGNILAFHTGLTNSEGHVHPWESKPWTWPMGLRPMLYYFVQGEEIASCGATECVRAVMLVGTPAMWWLSLPVLAWALWKVIAYRDWRYGAALTGYLSVYLPWFATLDRQMYFFYAAPMAPFMVMLFALALGEALGRRGQPRERRHLGALVVCIYVAIVIANFVWLYPILTALPITPEMWQRQLWLPSWR